MTNTRLTRRGAAQVGKLDALAGRPHNPPHHQPLNVVEGYNAGYAAGKRELLNEDVQNGH